MRIFKHLRTDWFRDGVEFLAVIVGILVAFALENWNYVKSDRACFPGIFLCTIRALVI